MPFQFLHQFPVCVEHKTTAELDALEATTGLVREMTEEDVFQFYWLLKGFAGSGLHLDYSSIVSAFADSSVTECVVTGDPIPDSTTPPANRVCDTTLLAYVDSGSSGGPIPTDPTPGTLYWDWDYGVSTGAIYKDTDTNTYAIEFNVRLQVNIRFANYGDESVPYPPYFLDLQFDYSTRPNDIAAFPGENFGTFTFMGKPFKLYAVWNAGYFAPSFNDTLFNLGLGSATFFPPDPV